MAQLSCLRHLNVLAFDGVCWRMLANADECWRTLTYAGVAEAAQRSCLRHPHVLAFYGADVSRRMLTCTRTYAGVYADVCRGVQVAQLSCLRHPNVLAFYGAVTKGEQCSLLVELMDRDLRAFLHDNMRPSPHCTQVLLLHCSSKGGMR